MSLLMIRRLVETLTRVRGDSLGSQMCQERGLWFTGERRIPAPGSMQPTLVP